MPTFIFPSFFASAMGLQNRLFYLAGFDRELVKLAGIRSRIAFMSPKVDLGSPGAASQYFGHILELSNPPVLLNDSPDRCARFILGRIAASSGMLLGDLFSHSPFDQYSVAVVNPAYVASPQPISAFAGLPYDTSERVQLVASVSDIPKEGIEAVLDIPVPEPKPTLDWLRETCLKASGEYFAAINGDRTVEAAYFAKRIKEMEFFRIFVRAKCYEPVITRLLECALQA